MTSSRLAMYARATAKVVTQQQRENFICSPAVAFSLTPPAFGQLVLLPTTTALRKRSPMSMTSLQPVGLPIANTKATIGARWHTSDRPMCPAFHVDRVELRATLSLQGPGTEIRLHGGERALLRSTAPGDLVVMKGTLLDPVGCMHRSPPTSMQRQILTLDVMAE